MQVSVVRFRPWAPFARSIIDITHEFFRFPNPSMKVWEFLAAFCSVNIDRVGSKPLLIGGAGVARNFFERGMSSHRRDLLFRASSFGQTPSRLCGLFLARTERARASNSLLRIDAAPSCLNCLFYSVNGGPRNAGFIGDVPHA
jgi:hypothetical protein